jgi:hypothetical protein
MELCKAICKNGKACSFKAKCGGHCKRHHKEGTECSICLEKTNETVSITCKHTFHKDCISEWITRGHRTCPLCRGAISVKSMLSIGIKLDTRVETIRSAELYLLGRTCDETPLLDRYRHVLQYDIASILESEVLCRYKVIEFLNRRVKTKKGEKEKEKLKNEIEQINVWINSTKIAFTFVDDTVENIVALMIQYLGHLHRWDNLN